MNYGSLSGKAARATRVLLADKRKSIEWLSETTGISLSTIKRRLLGSHPFTVDEVGLVATAFDVPITVLLQDMPFSREAA